MLVEAVEGEVHSRSRVCDAVAWQLARLDVRNGWGSAGPRRLRTSQGAWRWAGHLLVAEVTQ